MFWTMKHGKVGISMLQTKDKGYDGSAYHMQHVVCHVEGRNNSAIKFDRVEIVFILALFYWLNH